MLLNQREISALLQSSTSLIKVCSPLQLNTVRPGNGTMSPSYKGASSCQLEICTKNSKLCKTINALSTTARMIQIYFALWYRSIGG